MIAALLLAAAALCLAGCSHASVSAQAGAASQADAGAQAASSAQEGAQAQTGTQSGSAAGVTVKRGARHFGVKFSPAPDGGQPIVSVDMDDEPDEITAGSSGAADAGAESSADAGVSGSADAGAAGVAAAGAKGEAKQPSSFTLGKFFAILGGIVALAGFVWLAWKIFKPRFWP